MDDPIRGSFLTIFFRWFWNSHEINGLCALFEKMVELKFGS